MGGYIEGWMDDGRKDKHICGRKGRKDKRDGKKNGLMCVCNDELKKGWMDIQ